MNDYKILFLCVYLNPIQDTSAKKSVQNYLKDAECAETNGKSCFLFLPILFFELWSFLYSNYPNFRWLFIHKSKNGNLKKISFRFSYYSAHFASFIKIWPLFGKGGGGLHILNWVLSVVRLMFSNKIRFYFHQRALYVPGQRQDHNSHSCARMLLRTVVKASPVLHSVSQRRPTDTAICTECVHKQQQQDWKQYQKRMCAPTVKYLMSIQTDASKRRRT